MVCFLRNGDSTGTFVSEARTAGYLKHENFQIEALDTWTSRETGARSTIFRR
jgi:hypothetical protein